MPSRKTDNICHNAYSSQITRRASLAHRGERGIIWSYRIFLIVIEYKRNIPRRKRVPYSLTLGLLAQAKTLYLSSPGARQCPTEFDGAGILVGGDALFDEVLQFMNQRGISGIARS